MPLRRKTVVGVCRDARRGVAEAELTRLSRGAEQAGSIPDSPETLARHKSEDILFGQKSMVALLSDAEQKFPTAVS